MKNINKNSNYKMNCGISVGNSYIASLYTFGSFSIRGNNLIINLFIPKFFIFLYSKIFYWSRTEYRNIPKKFVLNLQNVDGYSLINIPVLSFISRPIRIFHSDVRYPSYIQIRPFNNDGKIIVDLFKKHNKSLIKPKMLIHLDLLFILSYIVLPVYLIKIASSLLTQLNYSETIIFNFAGLIIILVYTLLWIIKTYWMEKNVKR